MFLQPEKSDFFLFNSLFYYLLKSCFPFYFISAFFLFSQVPPIWAQDSDSTTYVTRTGTFLISREPDPYENDYIRVAYAPVGTVLFAEGSEFEVRNKQTITYRKEVYLPVITEGGIRGAALKDCLFQPRSSRLVVPQHFQKKLTVFFRETPFEFSRTDGLFAEIKRNNREDYAVSFPFQYPLEFNEHCGKCAADEILQQEGRILKDEIESEEAKIIIPGFYDFPDLMVFKNVNPSVSDLVESLIKCMDGTIFTKVSQRVSKRIIENATRFYEFLTGCGLETEADLSLRTEFFGAGGGLTLSKEIKPKDRKISLGLYQLIDFNQSLKGLFLVIKHFECKEGKATRMKRYCMVDLENLRCFDLLEAEISRATDLVHVPKGDDISREAMFTIREHSGHDDVFKLYRFILKSRDFRKFASIEGVRFDYTHRKVRVYLDFIVDQIADFRRTS